MTRKTKRAARRRATRGSRTATGSVISSEYRKQHQPDEFALRLKKHVANNDGGIDLAKLRALAEANNAWDARYAKLNAGMQRLNVGNRLRALMRRGGKILWDRP